MKKQLVTILGVALLSVCLVACGWKPDVAAMPITVPWSALNLPATENAIVWKSEPGEFRAVHKEDKKTITKNNTDVLKAQGWTLGNFNDAGFEYTAEMNRGAERIALRFYDFANTGVVIGKK